MKDLAAKSLLTFFFLLGLFPVFGWKSQAGALVRTVITGRVIGLNYEGRKLVRFTVERLSGIRSHRFVVIRHTDVYYQGREGQNPQSPQIIQKGMIVRAEGGLTTFGDRIVADKIVILKP